MYGFVTETKKHRKTDSSYCTQVMSCIALLWVPIITFSAINRITMCNVRGDAENYPQLCRYIVCWFSASFSSLFFMLPAQCNRKINNSLASSAAKEPGFSDVSYNNLMQLLRGERKYKSTSIETAEICLVWSYILKYTLSMPSLCSFFFHSKG